MNQEDTSRRRRIVVTLDTGRVDTADLERMTRLARRLDAEIEGVFVEDSDLLRLAGLAFAQEFRPTSRRAQPVQSARVQQELRIMARRAQRTLAEYAEHRGVRWSFRTWRGSVERELLSGVEADVLALTRLGAVVVQPARRRARELISAYFDDSEEAARALGTAADLATDADQVSLQVLLAQGPDARTRKLRQRAGAILRDYEGDVAYRSLAEASMAELVKVLRDSGTAALVMQRDNELLRSASLRAYLSHLHCPLFLVR